MAATARAALITTGYHLLSTFYDQVDSKCFMFIDLFNLHKSPRKYVGRWWCYPHFTDKENESEGNQITWPRYFTKK